MLEIAVYVNIIALRSFYASPLGQHVQQAIAAALRPYHCPAMGGSVAGERIMGLGYATPYLAPFARNAERCFAFMPARQGASIWPTADCVATALVCEKYLPLPDASMDRILVIHALEQTENAEETMRELWRVLVPNGRLVVVVANRRGLWAHAEFTPFGNGEPYSSRQLQELLQQSGFSCGSVRATLHFLPCKNRHCNRLSFLGEKFIQRFFPCFGGALVMEAQKQLYRCLPVARRHSRRVPVPVLRPQTIVRHDAAAETTMTGTEAQSCPGASILSMDQH